MVPPQIDGKCKRSNDCFTQFRGQFIVGHVNQLGIHDLLDFTNLHLIRELTYFLQINTNSFADSLRGTKKESVHA